jgi:CheY-like chemotaxis protein
MGKALFLIVDDDPQLPQALMRIAGRYFLDAGRDIETLIATSAEEAMKLVDQKSTCCPEAEWGLFTDYDMPGMSGAQLVDALDTKLGDKLLLRVVSSGRLGEERRSEIEAKQAFAEKPMGRDTFHSFLHIFMTSLS